MNLRTALAGLYARVPLGMRLGLERMEAACARFDHPERAWPAVHVAGTNGKGSVAAMVEAAARADGKKTGLFTSPHLARFAERIRIDGEPIGDTLLTDVLDEILEKEPDLSFFEVATLAAFVVFAREKVDLAVIEVGIGGRLDATNVIPFPLATAVTRVAFDHKDKLGNTLDAIAREKASIAKSGVPIVFGALDRESKTAATEVAKARLAPIVEAAHDAEACAIADAAPLALRGEHQRDNARVAAAVARLARIPSASIVKGLATVRWPGRLEIVDGRWLLDGAHNVDGAEALSRHLSKERALGRPPAVLLFGVLADKEWPPMLDVLAPHADRRIYVAPEGRAPVPPSDLAARHTGTVATSVDEAIALARHAAGDGIVVVAGSLFLVGRVRSTLLGLPSDPIVAL